ncbi:putative oxidoreductase [Deinococcus metalli]|uniref:Putative oxidoreductase n=1 Tax=Deinococcus metalli TaxID=1141878 RepID=A0A7W8KBY9_9DEIO|nr:DoxX family protein [Deinococcus metalli]MBB5375370.1 putative oxidoreductase [Deinococcus metalli]GHF29822.1 hypothetical protein GCM10017781_02260 [Deinococcus metalli]
MPPRPDLALALVRIATGGVFAVHGWQAVFTTGLTGLTRLYAAAGVPLPLLVAPVTAILDLLGGVLLVLGVGARGLAGLLGGVTVLLTVARWAHGLLPVTLAELCALLVAGCAAVAVGGAGQPAVDGWRPGAVAPAKRTRSRR